jgi:hypothetical protein
VRKPRRPLAFAALVGAAILALALATLTAVRAQEAPNGGVRSLVKDEAQIRALIEGAGWVSPDPANGRFVYMVSFRSCPDCIRYEREEFPALKAAGYAPLVIMVARRERSTAAERSGVAQLWAKRDWSDYLWWTAMPVPAWTAEGLPVADKDPERAALVEKGRLLVDRLEPLLAENGIGFAYPTLIWTGRDGHLEGCACEAAETYPLIRQRLGLPTR